MASMLSRLFACCGKRRRTKHREPPDEESLLIPPAPELITPTIPNVVVVDQGRLKERLSFIVRSKEEKMVNVNSRLPFNLHNKKLSLNFDASPSPRSASTSTLHHSNGTTTTSLSPLHSRSPYQQHAAFVHTPVNTAPSRSSSIVSHGNDSNSSDFEIYPRAPILNLRLVTPPISTTSSKGERLNNRGRSRQKPVDASDVDNSTNVLAEAETVHAVGLDSEGRRTPTNEEPPPTTLDHSSKVEIQSIGAVSDGPSTPRGAIMDGTPRASTQHPQFLDDHLHQPAVINTQPLLSILPAAEKQFILHDYDGIAVEWND